MRLGLIGGSCKITRHLDPIVITAIVNVDLENRTETSEKGSRARWRLHAHDRHIVT